MTRKCKLPVLKELLRLICFFDVIGRCASKNDPLGFEFQPSTTFGEGVKESVILALIFGQKWLSPFNFLFVNKKLFCSGVGLAACWAY